MNETPKIYVADLAAYNSGFLHGVWIEVTDDKDALWDAVNAMLANSPIENSEEFAIHDYEGFGEYPVREYQSLEHILEIAAFIKAFPETGDALLCLFNDDIEQAQNTMENDYCGCYDDAADFAQELTEETTVIPQNIAYYIDYERMANDIEMNGDIITFKASNGGVHIFWNH
ncbi:MAG: antirestriction protein ArdA [Pseudomonadota bacterium]